METINTIHKEQKSNTLVIMAGIGGALLMLFFAKMMYDMVGYVGSMAKGVDAMSDEMVNISRKIDTMSTNMAQLNTSISHMDIHMEEMNKDIHAIQEEMAIDIDAMSKSMEKMTGDMDKGIDTFTTGTGLMKIFLP